MMTTYQAAYVYNGSNWVSIGAQIPNIPLAVPLAQYFGNDNATLDETGNSNKSISFPYQAFGAIPSLFTQVTGNSLATILITNVTLTGATLNIKGSANATVSFNWMAVQPRS
jgi:hypothetical protein